MQQCQCITADGREDIFGRRDDKRRDESPVDEPLVEIGGVGRVIADRRNDCIDMHLPSLHRDACNLDVASVWSRGVETMVASNREITPTWPSALGAHAKWVGNLYAAALAMAVSSRQG